MKNEALCYSAERFIFLCVDRQIWEFVSWEKEEQERCGLETDASLRFDGMSPQKTEIQRQFWLLSARNWRKRAQKWKRSGCMPGRSVPVWPVAIARKTGPCSAVYRMMTGRRRLRRSTPVTCWRWPHRSMSGTARHP